MQTPQAPMDGGVARVVRTYVCFLTVTTLRPVASLSSYQISTTRTVPPNSEAKEMLPAWSCFCQDFFHRKEKNNEENRSQEWCPYYDDRSDHVLPRIFRNWLARGVWKNLERWDRQAINCWNVFRKVKKMKTVEVWIMKFLIETRVLLRTGPVSFMLYSGREFDYILLMSWEFEWSQIRNWWTKVFGGRDGMSRLDIIQSVPWFLLTA